MIFNTRKFLAVTLALILVSGMTSPVFSEELSNSPDIGGDTDGGVVNTASGLITSCTNLPISRTLDTFYTKCSTDSGMVVASSDVVPNEALLEMNRIIIHMTKDHPEIIEHLNQHGIIFGVIGENQVTTDMPEHSDLNTVFPIWDWDTRTRGVGATLDRPLVSAAEENLLCYLSDPYVNGQTWGESIAMHEFAHTLFEYGLVSNSDSIGPGQSPPTSYWPGGSALFSQLQSIYQNAINQGRWQGTYGGSNWAEFFAVTSQVYFDANDRTFEYDFDMTREGLEQYEPAISSLLATVYPDDWRYSCPIGSPVYDCKAPSFSDISWNITSSCTMKQDIAFGGGDIFVKNNSVLTISNGTTLYAGLEYSKLIIESGSGVLIKSGGAIT